MHITIVVYPGVTMLDAVGPAEVLTRLPEASVTVASLQPAAAVRSDTGGWAMQPDAALADVASTDLLLVPGGPLTGTLAEDAQVAASLQRLLNERIGMSFFEYVNYHRIHEFIRLAKSPLIEQKTLLAIAQEAGFQSKSTFYKSFKQIMGCPPSEYLKRSDWG